MSSESEALLDELIAGGVLDEGDQDGRLEITERFESERATQRARLADSADKVDQYAAVLDADPAELDREIVADALTIQELVPSVDRRQALIAADAVDRLADDDLAAGVPEGFVAVRPEEVTNFVENHEGAVVYFWGDDCDPCDQMHEEFSELVTRDMVPENVALGATYLGRDADIDEETVDLIADEWMVTVIPTTLFFLNGRIDTRYYGWKPATALQRELEILSGYVTGRDLSLETEETNREELVERDNRGDDTRTPPDDSSEDGSQEESHEPSGQPSLGESVTPNLVEEANAPSVEEMTAGRSGFDNSDEEYSDRSNLAESFTDIRDYIEGMTAEGASITFEREDAEELSESFEEIERPAALWRTDDDGQKDDSPGSGDDLDSDDSIDEADEPDGT